VALLGSVLSSGYRSGIASTAEQLPAGVREPVESGIGSALAVSGELGDAASVVVSAARQAFVEGWRTSMWVGVALAAIGFAYVALRSPGRSAVVVTAPVAEPDDQLEFATVTT